MVKLYHVRLSDDDRKGLEQVIARSETTARIITRARILVKATKGWHDEDALHAGLRALRRTKGCRVARVPPGERSASERLWVSA